MREHDAKITEAEGRGMTASPEMETRDGNKVFYRCPRYKLWFQFGPHRYEGTTLPSGTTVCSACVPD